MPPEPALSFTIPSVGDGTALDCRIYHPQSLAASPGAPPWRRHAAVVAHPYAPMGGSYDDPVVETVLGQLLRRGFLVGTFNFRGAGRSAGRTSWTAKPELDDYSSFAAFLVFYVHYLDPFRPHHSDVAEPPVSSTPSSNRHTLLMGGYSYGSMITARLPPIEHLVAGFESPDASSNAAHIRLRAESMASRQNVILGSARAAMLERRDQAGRTKAGVRIGGEEGGGSPRKSHDSSGRRSLSLDVEERLRKSLDDLAAKTRPLLHRGRSSSIKFPMGPNPEMSLAGGRLPPVAGLIVPRPAYLLISPLLGIITHLATMSLVPSALARSKEPRDVDAELKLIHNPTLAVYGDGDVFVAVDKLRAWTKKLQESQGSRFNGREIASAGHFWTEEGVLYRMRDFVDDFAGSLLDEG